MDKRTVSGIASQLGKRAKGVPKRFSEAELERRRRQMQEINQRRKAKAA